MLPESDASPCNKVCLLNAGQVCIGCGRHVEEIATWSTVSRERRLQIRQLAAARLRALDVEPTAARTPKS